MFDTVWDLYLSVSTVKKKKKAFHNICISVLKDAEQSRCCYTGEETIVLPPDKQHQVKLTNIFPLFQKEPL